MYWQAEKEVVIDLATVVEKGTATDESKDACNAETATNLVTSIL